MLRAVTPIIVSVHDGERIESWLMKEKRTKANSPTWARHRLKSRF
ncbi:MAG: hypothetical protein A4E72_00360 [Syntrophus sp. PtaU1.Bin208]|nr:MAG: hypothetical protein A4E72_00360 [Syntrophus sp. PtaU1.Bin208]